MIRRLPTRPGSKKSAGAREAQSKKSRRITFDFSKNTLHEIWHVNDYSREEIRATWVTAEEFMATKKHYTLIVRAMMKNTLVESEDCCTRGLEFKTKEGARQRKRNKQKAVRGVLEEQDIQGDEGLFDPDFISDVYREVAGPCSLEALNRGLMDQKAMLELLDPQLRLEQERRITPNKKSIDVVKPRRPSFTETLNGNEMQARRLIATPT